MTTPVTIAKTFVLLAAGCFVAVAAFFVSCSSLVAAEIPADVLVIEEAGCNCDSYGSLSEAAPPQSSQTKIPSETDDYPADDTALAIDALGITITTTTASNQSQAPPHYLGAPKWPVNLARAHL